MFDVLNTSIILSLATLVHVGTRVLCCHGDRAIVQHIKSLFILSCKLALFVFLWLCFILRLSGFHWFLVGFCCDLLSHLIVSVTPNDTAGSSVSASYG